MLTYALLFGFWSHAYTVIAIPFAFGSLHNYLDIPTSGSQPDEPYDFLQRLEFDLAPTPAVDHDLGA